MKEIKGLKNIRESFRTKQVKYGGYAALITAALLVGLILVNLAVGQFPLQLDMTESGRFSLSEQSVQVLDMIDAPVRIYGLWPEGQENGDVTEVLGLYLARNKNLSFESLDPDRNPGFVQKYDRDRTGIGRGSVIVEGAKGFRVIPPADMYDISNYQNRQSVTGIAVERRLTSALLYVGTGETPVVYEISGHEESSLAALSLAETVERENYTLRQLNLVQTNIPQDASALIINAPRRDISRAETDKILDYLDRGGRLLVVADYRVREHSMLNEVLASYGLRFNFGVLTENDPSYTAGNNYIGVPDIGEHDITKPIVEKQNPVILPFSMGLSETGTKRRTVSITPLLLSSANSWLRTDLENNSPVRIASDTAGPVALAMAVMDPEYIQGTEKQARIVAIASGSMIEPATISISPSNIDFFMNSLTWLEDRPEALSVRSKSLFLLPMRLNGLQMIIFGGIFVVLIPLAFFISGLVSWLKRRHL